MQSRLQALGAGYSIFVRIAKFILPLAAIGIVGFVFANLSDNSIQKQIADIPKEEQTKPGQVDLVAAKYEGVDDEGQSYTISAEHATRGNNTDEVLLNTLKADITLKSGSWLAVHADNGVYNMKSQNMTLQGNVTLFHDSGLELSTDKLETDVRKKSAISHSPVKGHGPEGEISAANMEVTDGGNSVTFGGPATLRIYIQKGTKG